MGRTVQNTQLSVQTYDHVLNTETSSVKIQFRVTRPVTETTEISDPPTEPDPEPVPEPEPEKPKKKCSRFQILIYILYILALVFGFVAILCGIIAFFTSRYLAICSISDYEDLKDYDEYKRCRQSYAACRHWKDKLESFTTNLSPPSLKTNFIKNWKDFHDEDPTDIKQDCPIPYFVYIGIPLITLTWIVILVAFIVHILLDKKEHPNEKCTFKVLSILLLVFAVIAAVGCVCVVIYLIMIPFTNYPCTETYAKNLRSQYPFLTDQVHLIDDEDCGTAKDIVYRWILLILCTIFAILMICLAILIALILHKKVKSVSTEQVQTTQEIEVEAGENDEEETDAGKEES